MCSCDRDGLTPKRQLSWMCPAQRRGSSAGFSSAESRLPQGNSGRGLPHHSAERRLTRYGRMENGVRILIVDDHPSFRRCARALLEADGFAVIGEAEDGEGALSAIGSLRPDVDGFAVLEQLGTDGTTEPQVVLVSSREASDYDGLIRASGARGFISKAELTGAAVRVLLR